LKRVRHAMLTVRNVCGVSDARVFVEQNNAADYRTNFSQRFHPLSWFKQSEVLEIFFGHDGVECVADFSQNLQQTLL
jgi:hypothetical protein